MKDSVHAKIAATAATQYGLITRKQALAAGLSENAIAHLLRTARWAKVRRGVYRIVGVPTSWRQNLLAAVLAVGERAAAAGEAAAALWRVPGFPPGPIAVGNPVSKGKRQLFEGRQSCFLPEHHITKVDGIPVTTVARTIFDLMST